MIIFIHKMKDAFLYTRKVMNQLFQIRHNHKFKHCKGVNELMELMLRWNIFLLLTGGIVLHRSHNLKFDQNSLLRRSFIFYETLSK